MSKEVTMRASKRKPSKEAKAMAGKVRHIMIEGAGNGATTKTFMHPPAGTQPYDMPDPQPMVHTSAAGLGAHIAQQTADWFPKTAAKGKAAPAANDDDGDEAQAA